MTLRARHVRVTRISSVSPQNAARKQRPPSACHSSRLVRVPSPSREPARAPRILFTKLMGMEVFTDGLRLRASNRARLRMHRFCSERSEGPVVAVDAPAPWGGRELLFDRAEGYRHTASYRKGSLTEQAVTEASANVSAGARICSRGSLGALPSSERARPTPPARSSRRSRARAPAAAACEVGGTATAQAAGAVMAAESKTAVWIARPRSV
jgi:hypothetical protein